MYTHILLHTLLKLAHFLHNVYIAICYAFIVAYRKCTDLWCARTELDLLLRMRAKTKKIPRHLVIVLGLCDESVLDCVRIIGWCIALNIPYISFFDHNGKKTIWYQSIYLSVCEQFCREKKITSHTLYVLLYALVFKVDVFVLCDVNFKIITNISILWRFAQHFFAIECNILELKHRVAN